MKRSVVLIQLLLTALFAAVGGFVAVSAGSDAVDADRGGMTAAVPMMSQADVRATAAASSADLATTTITPVRIVDTRPGAGSLGGTKVPWGALETRTVETAGLGTIPSDAVGVVVNVTALNATAPDTFLTLFPTGSAMPNASTLNPSPGEVAFNAATVLLGPDGTFEIYNYSGTVDVIIDVTAYMTRVLADTVVAVETDVDKVENDLEEIEEDVVALESDVEALRSNYLSALDSAGSEVPIFRLTVSGFHRAKKGDYLPNVYVERGGEYWPVLSNSLASSVHYQEYFPTADCSGPPYYQWSDSALSDNGEYGRSTGIIGTAHDYVLVGRGGVANSIPPDELRRVTFDKTRPLRSEDMVAVLSIYDGSCTSAGFVSGTDAWYPATFMEIELGIEFPLVGVRE
jgi:hypothetical protein